MKSKDVILALTLAFALAPAKAQSTVQQPAQSAGTQIPLSMFVELLDQMLRDGNDALRRVSALSGDRAQVAAEDLELRVKYLKSLRQAEASESTTPAMRAMFNNDIAATEQSLQQLELEQSLAKERTAQLASLADDFDSATPILERMQASLENNNKPPLADTLSSDLCQLTQMARHLRRNQILLNQAVLAGSTSDWLMQQASEKHFVTALGDIIDDPNRAPMEHETSQLSRDIHSHKEAVVIAQLQAAQKEKAAIELRATKLAQEENEPSSCPAAATKDLSSEVVDLGPVLEEMAKDCDQARLRVVRDEIRQIDESINRLTVFQNGFNRAISAWQRDPESAPMPIDTLEPSILSRIDKLHRQREVLVQIEEQLSAEKHS